MKKYNKMRNIESKIVMLLMDTADKYHLNTKAQIDFS